jgi:hypothetical protein
MAILFLSACSLGQRKTSNNSNDKKQIKTAGLVPKDWKLIDLDNFSFILPKSMKDMNAEGIDSEVWEFEDSYMLLSIDSGDYTNNLQDTEYSYETKTEKVKIDGNNVNVLFGTAVKQKTLKKFLIT